MSKSDFSGKKSTILYSIHIPLILILILAFGGLLVTSYLTKASIKSDDARQSSVLGDDDDEEEDDDNSGSGNRDDDEDEDDDEDDDNSGSGSDDDDDENEDDDEEDDDNSGSGSREDDDEIKTEERVTNPDGTYSIIKRDQEDDKIELEIRTFDQNGNKIRVEKYKSEEGKEESRVAVYDSSGNKISDLRLKTEDGKELVLRVKEGETELSRVRFDVDKQELLVRTEEDFIESDDDSDENRSTLKISLDGNRFLLSRRGINALSNFPLSINDETGEVFVQTPNGEVELGVMPDSIVEKAQASDDLEDVSDVSLAASTDTEESSKLEYKLTGLKSQKLLGVFSLNIPSVLIYDAKTGDFLRTEQEFVNRILDLFSK